MGTHPAKCPGAGEEPLREGREVEEAGAGEGSSGPHPRGCGKTSIGSTTSGKPGRWAIPGGGEATRTQDTPSAQKQKSNRKRVLQGDIQPGVAATGRGGGKGGLGARAWPVASKTEPLPIVPLVHSRWWTPWVPRAAAGAAGPTRVGKRMGARLLPPITTRVFRLNFKNTKRLCFPAGLKSMAHKILP